MAKKCKGCGKYAENCDCEHGFEDYIDDEEEEIEIKQSTPTASELKSRYPGYRDESYGFGAFLGLDFPYVAGDPGL